MRIKNVLVNGFLGLFVVASTHGVVLFAGNCLWYCDDNIHWRKVQVNVVGQPGTKQCENLDSRHADFIYTDDSNLDKLTVATGTVHYKRYGASNCSASCDGANLTPYKTNGSPGGDVISEGDYEKNTCSMKGS